MKRIIASILLMLSISAFALDMKEIEDQVTQMDITIAELQTQVEWARYTAKIAKEQADEQQATFEEEFRERQVRRMYELAKFQLECSIYNARKELEK